MNEDRIGISKAMLLDASSWHSYGVTGDLQVSEESMAKLLNLAPGHLKNIRSEGKDPPSYCIGVNGCRMSYRLADLASWIEQRRDDW